MPLQKMTKNDLIKEVTDLRDINHDLTDLNVQLSARIVHNRLMREQQKEKTREFKRLANVSFFVIVALLGALIMLSLIYFKRCHI